MPQDSAPQEPERRREPRFPVEIPVNVYIKSEFEDKQIEARIIDVSTSGLRITTSRYFTRGRKLRIIYRDLDLVCEVANCRSIGVYSFEIGLKLMEANQDPGDGPVNPLVG
jgi:hypothetical protein